ncbi:mucin-5AC-like [Ptychodera flava]|uniref:mucin-5AC-like n=1 Tax=Ptychodera flava TaxID=63121 RepID=UPI00396AB03E
MESVKTAEQNLDNLCFEWTEWLDDENGGTLDPSSIGEFELLAQLRGPYGFCDQPTDIECRLSDLPHTPYNQTGQVALTCDLQQGFLCFHSQQSGLCFNYAIRLLCETQCNTSTTPSENMTEFTSTSIKYPQTFPTIPGNDRVTQSATQSSTTFLRMESVKTAEQNLNNLCFEWTEWLDDENGGTLDPSSIGEFELLAQLRGPYGFCDQPTDIECNDRVTQSATQSSTTFLHMESVKTAQQNLNNLCFEWTEWLDDENGGTLDPSSIGEFELLAQLRGPYGFCDQPTE